VKAENQFFSYWPALLALWAALYILLGLPALELIPDKTTNVGANNMYVVGTNLLNNLTCIPFIGMYYEFSEKTTDFRPAAKLWLPAVCSD
jgi:hypothetical protein